MGAIRADFCLGERLSERGAARKKSAGVAWGRRPFLLRSPHGRPGPGRLSARDWGTPEGPRRGAPLYPSPGPFLAPAQHQTKNGLLQPLRAPPVLQSHTACLWLAWREWGEVKKDDDGAFLPFPKPPT